MRWFRIDWSGFGRTRHWLRGQALLWHVVQQECAEMSRKLAEEMAKPSVLFQYMERNNGGTTK